MTRTAEGEAYILLLAVEDNQGEEMKGTPLISYTSNLTHWLSNQPWQMCVSVCVPMPWNCLHLYIYASGYILHLLRITLHCCINCLRSVVIFAQSGTEQSVLKVSGRYNSAGHWKGFDLSGPSHTQHLVLCRSSLTEVRGDTIATLIDRVNKYSVLVPVRCSLPSNTLPVFL